jgi:hypothetical protein
MGGELPVDAGVSGGELRREAHAVGWLRDGAYGAVLDRVEGPDQEFRAGERKPLKEVAAGV